MPAGKTFKRHKEWGRRVRGTAKGRRSAMKGRQKKRKVFYEMPVGGSGKARCSCHYSYPCGRSA